MSQICALIVLPSTWIERVANSTPVRIPSSVRLLQQPRRVTEWGHAA